MVEPARQFDDEEVEGHEDSPTPDRSRLRKLEGGGETSEPNRDWYNANKQRTAPDRNDLANIEGSGGQTDSAPRGGTRRSFRRGAREKGDSDGQTLIRGRITKKRGGIIGGLIASIVGIYWGFSLFSGPFQFIHLSQLLIQYHFVHQQSAQDNRFMHELRWLRYSYKGSAENARMNILGNKFTNIIEKPIIDYGLTPRYSSKFGVPVGFEIDESKFKHPDGTQMKPDEIKAKISQDIPGAQITPYDGKYGDIDTLKKDKLIVVPPQASKGISGLAAEQRFYYSMLKSFGWNSIAAAEGARTMCARRLCSLHPISVSNLKNSTLSAAEKLKAWRENRDKVTKEGATPTLAEEVSSSSDPKKAGTAEARAAAEGANSTVRDAQAPGADPVQEGSKLKTSVKAAGGGLLAIGIACTLRQIDSRAAQVKDAQVVAPLIRMGTEAVAVGEQVKSNQDLDTETLGNYSSLLYGKDSTGKNSGWVDAASVQAEMGGVASNAVQPSSTLKTAATTDAPFHALSSGDLGGILDKLCGGIGGFLLSAIGFATGGVINAAASPLQNKLLDLVTSDAANWIAGAAINPDVAGADYGNAINYGSRLAANDTAIGAGGRALNNTEEGQLTALANYQSNGEFNSHNLAYKIFNPYDKSTAIAKLIDRSTPSFSHNLATLSGSLFNIGHSLASLPHLFTGVAHADSSTPYPYGFPEYGFSADELSNPEFNNPFENACHVVGCKDKGISGFLVDANGNSTPIASGHKGYIDRAEKCFGVTISPDSNGKWDVTNSPDGSAKYGDIQDSKWDCGNTKDDNWTRLRFFIMDSETMNSMACYIGDSSDPDTNQACSDVGFAQSTNSGSSPNNSGVGTYLNPLRDVEKNGSLTPGRIDEGVDYGGHGPLYALGNGKVLNVYNCGWGSCNGLGGPGAFIVYQLSDGAAAGKYVYVAENCPWKVSIGDNVTSSTVLCTMVDAPPHIEMGWADGSALGSAAASSVYIEGNETAYGINFNDLLKSLGAPGGFLDKQSDPSGQILGQLPAGWPTW